MIASNGKFDRQLAGSKSRSAEGFSNQNVQGHGLNEKDLSLPLHGLKFVINLADVSSAWSVGDLELCDPESIFKCSEKKLLVALNMTTIDLQC